MFQIFIHLKLNAIHALGIPTVYLGTFVYCRVDLPVPVSSNEDLLQKFGLHDDADGGPAYVRKRILASILRSTVGPRCGRPSKPITHQPEIAIDCSVGEALCWLLRSRYDTPQQWPKDSAMDGGIHQRETTQVVLEKTPAASCTRTPTS